MAIVANGIDYSNGWPTGQEIVDAGYDFAARYMGQDSRCLTLPEKKSLDSAKVNILAIAEFDSIVNGQQISAMQGGYSAGQRHAAFADDCRSDLVLPGLMPLYFTLDVEPGSVDWSLVNAYLHGAADTIGGRTRVGLYGGVDAIAWAVETNAPVDWYWQTYAWSGTRLHPRAHLYQYDIYGESVAGIDVDLNKAFAVNYGQAAMFDNSQVIEVYAVPMHPDWYPASLSERYPTVGRWEWRKQTLVLHTVRHNAHLREGRNSNQYSEPSTDSPHSGPLLLAKSKVAVERMADVKEVHDGKKVTRSWVLTGNGTWIPEDVLDLDFSITPRRKLRG